MPESEHRKLKTYKEEVDRILDPLKQKIEAIPHFILKSKDDLFAQFMKLVRSDPDMDGSVIGKLGVYINGQYEKLKKMRGLQGAVNTTTIKGNNVHVIRYPKMAADGKVESYEVKTVEDEMQAVAFFESIMAKHKLTVSIKDYNDDRKAVMKKLKKAGIEGIQFWRMVIE